MEGPHTKNRLLARTLIQKLSLRRIANSVSLGVSSWGFFSQDMLFIFGSGPETRSNNPDILVGKNFTHLYVLDRINAAAKHAVVVLGSTSFVMRFAKGA